MGIRRPGTKGYEEVDGVNLPTNPNGQNASAGNGINNNSLVSPEFELASVSVVPDGTVTHFLLSSENIFNIFFRYFYCCAGG